MVRSALLAAALLTAAALTSAQHAPDPHFLAARISAIARQSVFVHGYLHGYEEGFHFADIDFQMGRKARDVLKIKEAKKLAGYRREFGDKGFFDAGYRQGLRVGYGDGMANRPFRAINELESLNAALTSAAAAAADPVFDQGFAQGYLSGQQQGLQDGRQDAAFTPSQTACPAEASRGRNQQIFCGAYVGGYRFGYSDGFTNVTRPILAQATARGGGK